MAQWTDAPKLFFHFNTENGLVATLLMVRVTRAFPEAEVRGIPGTVYPDAGSGSIVPGYKCVNCGTAFFVAAQDGLKHACMGLNGGVISDKSGTGGIE